MTVKMVAFTCCGHCPMAKVVLHKKCAPMDVYCLLQRDEETGTPKKVYSAQLLDKLDENCPLPNVSEWMKRLKGLNDEQIHLLAVETRFLTGPSSRSEVQYSRDAVLSPKRLV